MKIHVSLSVSQRDAVQRLMRCTRGSRATFASTTTNAHTAHWPIARRQVVTGETEEAQNPTRVWGALRSGLALRAVRLPADTACAPRQ